MACGLALRTCGGGLPPASESADAAGPVTRPDLRTGLSHPS